MVIGVGDILWGVHNRLDIFVGINDLLKGFSLSEFTYSVYLFFFLIVFLLLLLSLKIFLGLSLTRLWSYFILFLFLILKYKFFLVLTWSFFVLILYFFIREYFLLRQKWLLFRFCLVVVLVRFSVYVFWRNELFDLRLAFLVIMIQQFDFRLLFLFFWRFLFKSAADRFFLTICLLRIAGLLWRNLSWNWLWLSVRWDIRQIWDSFNFFYI